MKKILIIEDNPVQADLLKLCCETLGLLPTLAADAESGWEFLAENPDTALVTLDINLPGMNGLQLLRRIKADGGLAHVPVIMISALREGRSIDEAKRLGAEAYLVKPVQLDDVISLLEKFSK